jgi:thiol:disulfide interchange protein DsbC
MTMFPNRKRFLRTLVAAALVGLPALPPVAAQTASGAPAEAAKAADAPLSAEAAAVKKLLEQKFPGAEVTNVGKSGYFGLYEAQFDGQMVYTDPKVTYIVVGSIYDATTKTNLTEERQRKLNRVAWASLPLDLAFKRVKGKGTRKLAIFSDADCPFCARLEHDLRSVDDVTIYTFLYPIDQLHPDAARKSKILWCAPDRAKAWDEYFATGKLPNNKGDCSVPLVATHSLGEKLRVNATPTLVFADGTIIPGALPKERLEAELAKAETAAKQSADASK